MHRLQIFWLAMVAFILIWIELQCMPMPVRSQVWLSVQVILDSGNSSVKITGWCSCWSPSLLWRRVPRLTSHRGSLLQKKNFFFHFILILSWGLSHVLLITIIYKTQVGSVRPVWVIIPRRFTWVCPVMPIRPIYFLLFPITMVISFVGRARVMIKGIPSLIKPYSLIRNRAILPFTNHPITNSLHCHMVLVHVIHFFGWGGRFPARWPSMPVMALLYHYSLLDGVVFNRLQPIFNCCFHYASKQGFGVHKGLWF